jgi:predicted nucleic acid-binding protein
LTLLVVVDSNIIFASLIKNSATRTILTSSDIDFVVPEWVHSELREHAGEISRKAGVSEEEMESFIEEIFHVVQTVPLDEYEDRLDEALETMSGIDRDDAPFVAVALATSADAIWTNDAHFSRQNRVRIVSTREIVEIWGRGPVFSSA